jgi:photosystem II stability/assembly factor-like uncharacterized protein
MRTTIHRAQRSILWLAAFAAGMVWFGGTFRAQSQEKANPFEPLHFRFIGPMGGRTSAITGVVGQPAVAYIGSANGGIFKTSNFGITWKPLFENQHTGSIGALAVASTAPNVVWAGTGEPWIIRADPGPGDGVYKSTDGGDTWQHAGLEQTGHITEIVIDRQNANIVYVCSVGQVYKPGHERGIFKTTDGGQTWQQVLFVNEGTGCSDLVVDPHDPNTLFAGMWQVTIHTWDLHSGGPSSGVYVTHDAGATWQKLAGNGLPAADHPLGRVSVNIAQTNPKRVYALIEDHPPGLYRSDDGGQKWELVNYTYALGGRFPYDSRFGVSTGNEDLLYFLGQAWFVSEDAGKTLIAKPTSAGGDLHNIWIDPNDANHFMVSDDQDGTITWDGGKTYTRIVLPNSQFFHVITDDRIPYNIYGNKQDAGSFGAPSNNLTGAKGGITLSDWFNVAGSESGYLVPDPSDENTFWVSAYYGDIGRVNLKTGESRTVSPWPDAPFGVKPADMKYRYNWNIPILVSPHDHNRVYIGSQYVMMTTNAGQSWQVISPDLTLNEKSHEQDSGGVTPYNLSTFSAETVFAISESPLQAGVLWAGTADGQVQVTRDSGAHWNNVTKNMTGLPLWGTVQNIDPSHFEAGTAYVSVSLWQEGDNNPYVYKTADFGQTWKLISGDIPKSVFNFPLCLIEDPKRQGMLYLGTGNALYVTWDDGKHWTQLRNNLPPTSIKWLTIQKNYNDLVIATYGRGIWILDDLTPLRVWDKAQESDVYLFKPRPAYRYRSIYNGRLAEDSHLKVGENPPDGGDINLYLSKPAKDVTLTIKDANGETVRTLKVDGTAGLNRVWWNLEYDPAHVVKLRTPPPDAPWVQLSREGWRPIVSLTSFQGAPRVIPGTYTVQLSVNGKQLSEPMVVQRDPNSEATDQTISDEVAFGREVLGEYNRVADMINQLEWDSKQAMDFKAMLTDLGDPDHLLEETVSLETKIISLEDKLFQIHVTSASIEEGISMPMKLYERMAALVEAVMHGNATGGGAGFAPTEAEIAVNKTYQQELAECQREFKQLTDKEVPAFNERVKQSHLVAAIAP